jgi:hypothetical protein
MIHRGAFHGPQEDGLVHWESMNDATAGRFWFGVSDVDLRVYPVPAPRPFVANLAGLRRGGFKR